MHAEDPQNEQSGGMVFELVRPRFFTPSVVTFLVVLPIGSFLGTFYRFYQLYKSGKYYSPEHILVGALLASVILIVVTLIYRLFTRPRTKPFVEFKQDYVSLSKSSYSIRTIDVEYKDILSTASHGLLRKNVLVIDTKRRTFTYTFKKFIQADAPQLILTEIRRRIEGLDKGSELIAAMDRREGVGTVFISRKMYATWILLFSICMVFVVQILLASSRGLFYYISMGANAPVLVFDGQWYRLISANFLHAGFLHLFMNGIALLYLGTLLERMVGLQRFLVIYIMSAIGGSLASALNHQAAFSVGASTALFGLLGALLVLHIMYWSMLPAGFRQTAKWWVFIILLNGILPVLAPQIDIAAHAGGFLVGAGITWLLCRSETMLKEGESIKAPIMVAAALSILLCIAGLTVAAINAANPRYEDEIKFIDDMITKVDIGDVALNEIAWPIAVDPEASKEQLEVARKASEKGVELAPAGRIANHRDTLSTIYYRLGRLDEAVLTQLKALQGKIPEKHKRKLFSQMARFLFARTKSDGVMLIGDVKPEDVSITWTPKDESTDMPVVRIEFNEKLKPGAIVIAHLMKGDQPIGILDVRWRLKKEALISESPGFASSWPEDSKLKIGIIKKGRGLRYADDSKITYYDLDPEVMKRP